MEIITGVERQRRWRADEKLRIIAETEHPGASFAAVARRHEISRGLLWNWRQQVRRDDLALEPMPMFVPVQIIHQQVHWAETRPGTNLHQRFGPAAQGGMVRHGEISGAKFTKFAT